MEDKTGIHEAGLLVEGALEETEKENVRAWEGQLKMENTDAKIIKEEMGEKRRKG